MVKIRNPFKKRPYVKLIIVPDSANNTALLTTKMQVQRKDMPIVMKTLVNATRELFRESGLSPADIFDPDVVAAAAAYRSQEPDCDCELCTTEREEANSEAMKAGLDAVRNSGRGKPH